MAITFPVHPVEANREPLEPGPVPSAVSIQYQLGELWALPTDTLEDAVAKTPRFLYLELSASQVVATSSHPFLKTLTVAYDEHRPVALTPDHLWMVLMEGLAHHLDQDPERFRNRLVHHRGTRLITVRHDGLSLRPESPWHEVLPLFLDKLRAQMGARAAALTAPFSTTDPLVQSLHILGLMHVVRNYFEYRVMSICGIPSITLHGTPDDWRDLRARAGGLADFDLGFWLDDLLPILDAFVEASEGRVDEPFWRAMVKVDGSSGGPYYSGWVTRLFPYVESGREFGVNPELGKPLAPEIHADDPPGGRASIERPVVRTRGGGLASSNIPCAIRRTPFIWKHFLRYRKMEFCGGFVGVTQQDDGVVVPAVGWGVRMQRR